VNTKISIGLAGLQCSPGPVLSLVGGIKVVVAPICDVVIFRNKQAMSKSVGGCGVVAADVKTIIVLTNKNEVLCRCKCARCWCHDIELNDAAK
jgi:hypothetical protein